MKQEKEDNKEKEDNGQNIIKEQKEQLLTLEKILLNKDNNE